MKRLTIIKVTTVVLVMIVFLWVGQNGCKKTDSPFGVNAPQGVDVPTWTPTPVSGAIEVYIRVGSSFYQGVTVLLVDPNGNTLTPQLTQPAGFAPFNPTVLSLGIWKAIIPTQSVGYVLSVSGIPVTFDQYFYNSSLPFTITGPGQTSVSFYSGTNSISVAPVSQTYPLAYPFTAPLTVTYNLVGNLNIPVSISSSSLPSGMSLLPAQFVLGEGVTQQPVTFSKSVCAFGPVSIIFRGVDFNNNNANIAIAFINHSYPISIIQVCDETNQIFTLYTTNDCGVTWDYSIDSTHGYGNIQTGTTTSGQPVSFSDSASDNVNFSVWSQGPTVRGNTNLFGSGSVTILATTLP